MKPFLFEALGMLVALMISVWVVVLAVIRFRRATSNESKIMLAICLLFVLSLDGVALVKFGRDRGIPSLDACANNLRQIDGAKEQWALVNKKRAGDLVTLDEIASYLKGGAPGCPGGGTYLVGAVDKEPACSLANLNPPYHALHFKEYFEAREKMGRTRDRAILASQLVSLAVMAMVLRRRSHRARKRPAP